MEILYNPIGTIHTPFKDKEGMPIQSARSTAEGWVELFPEFSAGLEGIEGFSHLYLLYHLDRPDRSLSLKVKPFLDDELQGLFTTRHPVRPNAIGLSIVRLICRDANRLVFTGADMLDDTPLLDIKPYIPDFDVFEAFKTGWYERRKQR